MIDLVDIHKRFGQTEVLRGISLTVRRGEVCVLLGPSGGGKSTLLRTINGLESFDQGRIRVDDLELTAGGPHDRVVAQIRQRVGMVFQQFNLFPHRSVLENVTEAPRHVLRISPRTGRSRRAGTARAAWDWRTSCTPDPVRCRAASSSAWPSPEHWR